ncbi:MAG: AAA family ATPase, partial [Gammaproteobacteria bacterium]|nr:AAA family ATPase [Gammaproteobacteria bacterium]
MDEEIFFPLPANDEQRRIIRTLDRQKGVLVQGPPGTGKSHTIANLICHLLATGKRVLVTAKTPRALK